MLINKIQSILELQGGYTVMRQKRNKRSTNLYLQEGLVVEVYDTDTVVVRGKGDRKAVKALLGLSKKVKRVPTHVFEQFDLQQAQMLIAFPCSTDGHARAVRKLGHRLGLKLLLLDKKSLSDVFAKQGP